MAEIPTTSRVVIIGGGAVGVSALYHLAKAGWSDCVLMERNDLTAGSTWHSAGNVPTFSASWSIMNIQRYSAELYRGLGIEVDYPINYHVTGSIRLAHSQNRMREFKRACGMGRYQGMDIDLIGIDEIKEKYPFIETHDLVGALFDPNDGDIDPSQLTQALAKGARNLGASIIRFAPVIGISRSNGEWLVESEKGTIRCEYVVNAAGYYAQRVGEMFKPFGGRKVPMVAMSHQYILTDEIPAIEKWSNETGRKLPLLRDVDTSYYLRQEKSGLNLGPYERNCKAHWISPDDAMPDDFSFQLYQDDLDRLDHYVEDAMERVPVLQEAGIAKIINGPIPYAPDGLPLIGPMPGVKNAFEACVFTFGIAQAGGAGKVLSEWIVEKQTEWDMWSCDPRRYTDYTDEDYCVAKAKEVYGHEYAMHFPWHVWPAGRNKKLSPVHERVVELGGQTGVYNGWERANWFAHAGDDTSEAATQTWTRSGPWEPRIREECEAVRDNVGVLDLPGFARFNLSGTGAAEWLLGRIAGALPAVGRIRLAYFPTRTGRVLTEMSIFRHDTDSFTLITAGAAQWHDFELLFHELPDGGSLDLEDHTDELTTFIVTGPDSRNLLSKIASADFESPWLSHQRAVAVGKPVTLARVSYAGELGWEVHCANEFAPEIYDAIITGGAKPFGMWALNSLRLEKGYRAWKGDLSTDYSILESGLDRFLKIDKASDFPGKAALLSEIQQGRKKTFATFIVGAGDCDAPYMSTIWHNDEIVGEITSGGWGYRIDKSIALGIIRTDLATAGTEVEIEIYGERRQAIVQPDEPLWDPRNDRLRS